MRVADAKLLENKPWLRGINPAWSVGPLKTGFKILNGATPKSGVSEYWDGQIIWIAPGDLENSSDMYISNSVNKITEEGLNSCGTKLVPKGSIVLSTRAPIGSIGIAANQLCTNQGCKALVPISDEVNSEYFAFFLKSLSRVLNMLGRGTTFMEMATKDLSSLMAPYPSRDIQDRVAAYLKSETDRLNSLIGLKRELIESLRNYKRAIISGYILGNNKDLNQGELVTEWIGECPKSWPKKKLKYLIRLCSEKVNAISPGERYIGLEHVLPAEGVLIGNYDETSYEPESTVCSFKEGNVLFGKLRPYLAKAVVAEFSGVCSSEFLVFESTEFYPDYLKHMLILESFISEVNMATFGAKMPRADWKFIGNLIVPVPPLSLQMEICKYIEKFSSVIDELIDHANKEISKLENLKDATIETVVLGKVDIDKIRGGL